MHLQCGGMNSFSSSIEHRGITIVAHEERDDTKNDDFPAFPAKSRKGDGSSWMQLFVSTSSLPAHASYYTHTRERKKKGGGEKILSWIGSQQSMQERGNGIYSFQGVYFAPAVTKRRRRRRRKRRMSCVTLSSSCVLVPFLPSCLPVCVRAWL